MCDAGDAPPSIPRARSPLQSPPTPPAPVVPVQVVDVCTDAPPILPLAPERAGSFGVPLHPDRPQRSS